MRRSGNRISYNPQKKPQPDILQFQQWEWKFEEPELGLGLDGPNDLFQQSVDHRPDNLSPKFREVDVMGQIAVFPDVTLGVEDWF